VIKRNHIIGVLDGLNSLMESVPNLFIFYRDRKRSEQYAGSIYITWKGNIRMED
jgi:hypothetical protein